MRSSFFGLGFRAMFPVIMGVIPFGAVMGTVCANANLSLFQTMSMNVIVYAGAAQLAAMDLMTKNVATVVVVATGLVINLRFLLYSAAMSPVLQASKLSVKALCAHTLTDQSYAVMSANQDRFKTIDDTIAFYFGSAACMMLSWQASVVAGFVFGNFAPSSWALEYAVPLSFTALVIPTLKNRIYLYVAIFSAVVSVLLNGLPYRTGLIVTAVTAIAFGALLSRKKTRP